MKIFEKASVRLQCKSSMTQYRWNFLNPSTQLSLDQEKKRDDLLHFS